jgi:ABC-type cobalamin/Fe3+-siderophores transport system ATPase subunit
LLITQIRVLNYKSFHETPQLRLGSGFNIVVGANNAGKTALLKALSLTFDNIPHRSLATTSRAGTPLNPLSRVEVSFEIPKAELFRLLADYLNPFYVSHRQSFPVIEVAKDFVAALSDPIVLNVDYSPSEGGISAASLPCWGVPETGSSINFIWTGMLQSHGSEPSTTNTDIRGRLPVQLAQVLRDRIYLFDAERMKIGEAPIGIDPRLLPNAANLPSVLQRLQTSNPRGFQRYQRLVSGVFPEIQQITVPASNVQNVRILLWSTDPDLERQDLAMPLAESGTGTSQVLAILYVVVTAEYPRVILIDEPQSFLHPSAFRKLLEILSHHSEHQYVICTHSPMALTATNPSMVLLLKKEAAATVTQEVNPREATDLRTVLAEVGARISDVFGADSILWVEGRTEEQCFPLIRNAFSGPDSKVTGTVILGVRHTSDFQPRDAKATLELHQRLTEGGALLPPVVGFLFDIDGRSSRERADLTRQSEGGVRFLPRRMFENYFLVPEALAAVMNGIGGFREVQVRADEVVEWLDAHRWEREYFEREIPEGEQTDEVWAREGHGANLLAALFADLSERRVEYRKVRDGVEATKWICATNRATLPRSQHSLRN